MYTKSGIDVKFKGILKLCMPFVFLILFQNISFSADRVVISENETYTIDSETSFENIDMSNDFGGAIYSEGNLIIDAAVKFTGNSASLGGAIYNKSGTAAINNSTFSSNNTVWFSGGAIYNFNGNLSIDNSYFISNISSTSGGAIQNDYGTVTISNTYFNDNTASTYGGAIVNATNSAVINISNATFTSNEAGNSGGAIYNDGIATITDSDFTNNTASSKGGAIYNGSAAKLTIVADTKDVTFQGNTANSVSNAIYTDGTTTFTANSGMNIILNDGVSGAGSIIANGEGTVQLGADMTDYTGAVQIDSGTVQITSSGTYFNNASSTIVNGGTLDSANGVIDSISFGALTLNSDLTVAIDLSLSSQEADNYSATSVSGTGSILLDEINIALLEDADKITATIQVSNSVLKDYISFATTSSASSGTTSDLNGQSAYSWYITYETDDNGGYLVFNRAAVNLKTSVNADDTTKLYSMAANETVSNDIGDLNGTTQVIAGNGYDIIASGQSGIITTNSAQTLSVNTVNNIMGFESTSGGFIDNSAGAAVNIINTNASDNTAANGGFIYNSGTLVIQNGEFSENSATDGGVIYNTESATIIDSNFTDNTASSNGGAIYNAASGTLNIISDSSDVTFSGNTANGSSNAIYNEGTLNINSASTVTFDDSISGSGTININDDLTYTDANGDTQIASTSGTIVLNTDMSDYTGDVTLNGGTLQLTSSGVMFAADTFTVSGGGGSKIAMAI
ncbi:MAG: hypothetical protein LUE64_02400 [Candidatus Gastranaerophilales bacterium]|nr:hypothetical protein [Candidatus Gastranaerophilales bacterium]